jgi:hypothetical protein
MLVGLDVKMIPILYLYYSRERLLLKVVVVRRMKRL